MHKGSICFLYSIAIRSFSLSLTLFLILIRRWVNAKRFNLLSLFNSTQNPFTLIRRCSVHIFFNHVVLYNVGLFITGCAPKWFITALFVTKLHGNSLCCLINNKNHGKRTRFSFCKFSMFSINQSIYQSMIYGTDPKYRHNLYTVDCKHFS